eukprot:GILK01002647.1.p1 GENE.GILK01002647.1~~GILK01002647.1.p1  ORF type:complete len:461 (-),score=115.11 GILK01002647.1:239-1621(-)
MADGDLTIDDGARNISDAEEVEDDNADMMKNIFGEDSEEEQEPQPEVKDIDYEAALQASDEDEELDLEIATQRKLKRLMKKTKEKHAAASAKKNKDKAGKKRKGKDDRGSEKKKKKQKVDRPAGSQEQGTDDFIDDTGANPDEVDDDDDTIKVEGGIHSSDEDEDIEKPEGSYFDQVLDRMKKKRRKTDMSRDEEDEIVNDLIDDMVRAAEDDRQANEEQKPATSKLKMLPKVVKAMRRTKLHDALLSASFCDVLRTWLEPLPDGSLPNLNVRTEILLALKDMPIETNQLRTSNLGKVVMSMFRNPDETVKNKKVAQFLIDKWSRPIFELSTNYAELAEYEEEVAPRNARSSNNANRANERTPQEEDPLAASRKTLRPGDSGFSYHARIPQRVDFDFKLRPKLKSSLEQQETSSTKPSKNDPETTRGKLNKKLVELRKPSAKNGGGRLTKISIEGRGMAM